MTNKQATDKVVKIRERTLNDKELAEIIGITKVTLYTRLKKSNWKKSELLLIDTLNLNDYEYKTKK